MLTHDPVRQDGIIIDHNAAQAKLWEIRDGKTTAHNAATRNCGLFIIKNLLINKI